MRSLGVIIATASAALLLAACGSESVSVPSAEAEASQGAEIFATHCAGCHTIAAAGTQGSGNRALRIQGPDFNQRKESYDDVLFAIHNGGFSGAIMPQNIVVGDEAEAVATFVSEYSGTDVAEQPRPSEVGGANEEVGPANSAADSVDSAASSEEGAADSNSESNSGGSSQSSASE